MKNKKLLIINYKYLASLFIILCSREHQGANNLLGKVWLDNNELINAHGGGILYHNGTIIGLASTRESAPILPG